MAAGEKPLLTLTMILKDEARTIGATLASVKPFVDRWVILDTGSTDGTQDVVREAMAGVPGELHEEPFVDFATTRNRGLELSGEATEFILWLDADDELTGGKDLRAFLARERAARGDDRDAYYVRVDTGIQFDSARVVRSSAGWRFRGVVHEVICREGRRPPTVRIPGVLLRHFPEAVSAERSRRRWERDAGLLEGAAAKDPGDARTAFYLAQTYQWLGRLDDAERAFLGRIALGGWWEEVFESKMALARIAQRRGDPWPGVLARYLDAFAFAPGRAEPLHAIAMHYDAEKQPALAYLFARRGAELPLPTNVNLFLDEDIYRWKLADIVGACAYWIGEYEVGEQAVRRALQHRPDDARLQANLGFYLERKRKEKAKRRG
jgi:glycosyltransferase involved in cell wall biosynthesis